MAVVLGWWAVAHSSGQGWVQDLGDIVAAAVLVGLLGPWLVLRRLRVEVVDSPDDATAGLPVELQVRSTGPARLTPLSPAGEARTGRRLIAVPAGRAVLHTVVVEVASSAPFGLQWWSRRIVLPLPRALHVAPRRGAPYPMEPFLPDGVGPAEGAGRDAGTDGDLRAPRPYRPGDARRLVHWPSTAHTGELMVRELEPPQRPPTDMVVALPPDPIAAEAEAERAYATLLRLLDLGVPVRLRTREDSGPRTAVVRDRTEAARRLAASVSETTWPAS